MSRRRCRPTSILQRSPAAHGDLRDVTQADHFQIDEYLPAPEQKDALDAAVAPGSDNPFATDATTQKSYIFEDTAERDAFFTTYPDLLVINTLIVIKSGLAIPGDAFFASKLRGVFTTANFSDPAPVWTAINSIAAGGTLLEVDVLEVSAATGSQFAIKDRDNHNSVLYRRTDGDWTAVLTAAQAIALSGFDAPTEGSIWWITEYTGILYAGCLANGGPEADNYLFVLSSLDDGLTWGRSSGEITDKMHVGYPGSLLYAPDHRIMSMLRITVGYGGYQIWDLTAHRVEQYSGIQTFFAYYNPYNLQMYSTKGSTGRLRTVEFNETHAGVPTNTNWLVGIDAYPKMVFDTESAIEWILGGRDGIYGNHLLQSDDSWDTLTDLTPSGLGVVVDLIMQMPQEPRVFALARKDSGDIADPETLWYTEDLGTTVISKSGSDPENLSTTVSIPRDCGGAAINGVQFICS